MRDSFVYLSPLYFLSLAITDDEMLPEKEVEKKVKKQKPAVKEKKKVTRKNKVQLEKKNGKGETALHTACIKVIIDFLFIHSRTSIRSGFRNKRRSQQS